MVICEICGREMHSLTTHLTRTHKIEPSEYKKKFKVTTLISEECRNKISENVVSIYQHKYWIDKGHTLEEAKDIIDKIYAHNKENTIYVWDIEYWTNKGMSIEEAKQQISFMYSSSLENLIIKYGEIEGAKRYEEYRISRSVAQKKSVKGLTQEERNVRFNNTSLEKFISLYGEIEGVVKYNIYKNNCRKTSKRSLVYWSGIYPDEEIAKEKLKEYQSRNMKWWQETYLNDWETKRLDWMSKISNNGKSVSKESILFKNLFLSEYQLIEEFMLYDNYKSYWYDFLLKDYNLIVEYDGVMWHPDPNDSSTWKGINGHSYEDGIAYDNLKDDIAIRNGYSIIRVRSDAIDEGLLKIYNFINSLDTISTIA